MRTVHPARLLLAMPAFAAGVACNAVLGIEQYGPGPAEGGFDAAEAGASEGGSTENEAGPCTPGDKRCSGNDVETCDSHKSWGGKKPCSTGETCSGGSCYPTPPSCAPGGAGMVTCGNGGSGDESCCTTRQVVPTTTFDRSFDGRTMGYTSKAYPATVSSFRLDAFEITVGRFRPFVATVVAGWLPAPGSGKHRHLNGGKGLSGAGGGGYETGWDGAWSAELATTANEWNANLAGGTWTAAVGRHENLPITGIDWNEAYAFCIWDGGFLPSEAEWNDAAAGGSEQRVRPWASPYPPGSTSIECAEANYSGCAGAANAVGSESPEGDGRWGHSDLVGNAWEWTLDWFAPYAAPCDDCANLTPGTSRVLRGGSFHADSALVLASNRYLDSPTQRAYDVGARCARPP